VSSELDKQYPTLSVAPAGPNDIGGRLSGAIIALLCLLPIFTTILFGGVDNITWALVPMVWAVIVALWLVICWQRGGVVLNNTSLQLPLIGLLLLGLIQLLPLGGSAGEALSIPLSHALSMDPYTTRFLLVRLLVYVLFFAGCLTFINNGSRFRRVVLLIVIFGAVIAFLGIMQRLANPTGIYGLRETRQAVPFGPFVNQHHFAAFMEMTVGVTLGLIFGGVEGREKKALLAFAAVLMAIVIVWTGSRGGLIGFISTVVLVIAVNLFAKPSEGSGAQPKAKLLLTIGGVGLIFMALGAVLFLGGADQLLRGIGINNPSGDVTTGRAHFWPIALRVFTEHPLVGAGLDAFSVTYPAHDTWNGTLRVEQAHNDYLQMLADGGIIGFACVLAFIYLLFSKTLSTIRSVDGFRRAAAVGALAGCFGVMVHSFFDFPLRTPSNAFFFLMLASLATVSIADDEGDHTQRHRRRKQHHRRD